MSTQQTEQAAATENRAAPRAHAAFGLIRTEKIDSLNVVVEEYRHVATGAVHYHLAAENPENVFLVALRTVPMDSTGVAHILEHTALCGSRNYPVRDPFFMMIRRSLNTFMNAFTSSDWTAYPFASQNRKDFNNLMDVYLDAVFFSRLHELDFAQEGHRLEFAQPEDPGSELLYKGVVFNEMKGAMSSPVSALWQRLTEHLFPTTTYHYNSGGEPARIPDLSYRQLKDFYSTHYHPSNAVFMTYGDIPAAEHQARIEDKALRHFKRLDKTIDVQDEQRCPEPRAVKETYALDESETRGDKTHIVLGWLLGKSTDSAELMRAHLLTSVLLDNGASPLRRALETTNLGTAPSPLCGLEDSNREMSFMCGVEGSKPEHAEAVEELVLSVLRDVADNGVPQQMVEAVLHQLELNQREIKGDGYPYGLQLILEGLSPAIHRGDPVALLDLDPALEQLREDIRDPQFIRRLARDLLLHNPHRVRLTMVPDATLSEKQAQQERERLQQIRNTLSDEQSKEIVEQALALARRQQEEDDPEILPKVGLADIPESVSCPASEKPETTGMPLTYYTQGTNGLVYQQYVAELPQLDRELLEVLPLYTRCLTEIGSGGRDYLQTQLLMDTVTGGIHASTGMRGAIDDVQAVKAHFILSGKALARNREHLLDLMRDTMEAVRWDERDRIREIVAQERARAEQSVTGNGHGLAMLAASSGMSPAALLSHQLRGLTGIHELKILDDGLGGAQALPTLVERLAQLHQQILSAPPQFLLVAEEEQKAAMLENLDRRWPSSAPGTPSGPFVAQPVRRTEKQLWITSTQVNFCAKSYPTVPVEHADAAALAVLGGFLRNGFLHRAIREQGGAYGGGAGHEPDIAAFRFFSYRDPRLVETLNDFDRSIDWLLSGKHEWRQVEEAILGVIGSIDKPGSPAGEAKKDFHGTLYGRTPGQRQRFRARVLKVTLDDLLRVGEHYLKPENASVAVITDKSTSEHVGDLGLNVHHL